MPRLIFLVALVLTPLSDVRAGETTVALLPGSATLSGPRASQRFVVEARDGEMFVGDRTAEATFATEDPKVAVVEGGAVVPKRDGSTTLTATVGGRVVARAAIQVKDQGESRPWGFRNQVELGGEHLGEHGLDIIRAELVAHEGSVTHRLGREQLGVLLAIQRRAGEVQ